MSTDYLASLSAKRKQAKWLKVADPRVELAIKDDSYPYEDPNTIINLILDSYEATFLQKEVLKEYYFSISVRRHVRAEVLAYCFIRSYVSIIVLSIGALIMLITGFFISRAGWESINNAVINIFVSSMSVVFIYGSLMVALEYEENIKKNEALYVQYSNFANEFLGFLATQKTRDGQYISIEDFIVYCDLKLQELDDVGLVLDTDEVLKYRQNIDDLLNAPIDDTNNVFNTPME